jgi:hypothetical protein
MAEVCLNLEVLTQLEMDTDSSLESRGSAVQIQDTLQALPR